VIYVIYYGGTSQSKHVAKKVSIFSYKICEICYLLWRFFYIIWHL